jgi:hypothetical protein
MKKNAKNFHHKLFDWFTAHEPVCESTASKLEFTPKRGKFPYAFHVTMKDGTTREFLHQYDVASDSEKYKAKYIAVYWSSTPEGETRTAYVHYC